MTAKALVEVPARRVTMVAPRCRAMRGSCPVESAILPPLAGNTKLSDCLSASPRKFLVAISRNPGHMPPWCCPAGSRGANRRARCGSRQSFKPWLRIGTTAAFPATWAAFPSRLSAMGPPHAARDADKTAPPPGLPGASVFSLCGAFRGHSAPSAALSPKGGAAWFALAWASAREDDDVR